MIGCVGRKKNGGLGKADSKRRDCRAITRIIKLIRKVRLKPQAIGKKY